MGTRATIKIAKREEGVSFSEKPDKFIVSIYHHFDGYPEYLGVTLANYLQDKTITNGELLAYINENVSSKALEQGRKQNPDLIGDKNKILIKY